MPVSTVEGPPQKPDAMPFAAARALGLSFRTMGDADLPFLRRLYASTRALELSIVPWTDAQKAAFLDQQFRAQHTHYQTHYATAHWLVILRAGESIGRLYLDRWTHEYRLIDIAFLPEHCGQGLGAALLSDVIAEATADGKCVTIHVEKHNPAMRLYRRLGFVVVEDKGIYDLMRWTAPSATLAQVNTAS